MIVPGTISPYELNILKEQYYGKKDFISNSGVDTRQRSIGQQSKDSGNSEGVVEDGIGSNAGFSPVGLRT